ncbi:hypothetical protein A3E39_01250 [Candidatus Uhrbacteria bacterium RIFCSPHIGHO2_12_FULL_60_25]|uniref:Non-reducing end beta-L-arabinofuranosidase-like GH127 catalytic domain-containing protein n=1 Tax=Candidatus Uhrbacteria bacterium RIFCSPHIGHO2_12_FULL_60_25 TaxID=1802399 RepID=A0A1F7UKF6_9BACT|nr:MAG: hypothetical protein A3D73_02235 [Candidatus Uhrbacteria bacterium RIFCSPHIGHO2_02_FULL_60_44]OGL78770.1 MAG: hypothetical protein A3E39_01250 [Candidatus Uhrbacteria bacterium RIFCSPHIGHO2_12_FULL_60_25]
MADDMTFAAAEWLLNSGIQNPPGTHEMHGADVGGSFNAWFNPQTHTHSYIYTEISGYALTTLLYLYRRYGDARFKRHATLVGEWLHNIQLPTGALPTAFYIEATPFQKSSDLHAFDVGMVLNGLVCLHRETLEERYLQSAIRAADWIAGIQRGDGSVPAMTDAVTGATKDHEGTWSTQPGPYHGKLAIGLLNLFDLTRDPRYADAARALCNYTLTRQKKNGQFLTYGNLDGTNFHPHAYACEGLYAAGCYLNELRYLDAARRGTEWALSLCKDGIIPRHIHDERINYHERADIQMQISRLATLFHIQDDNATQLFQRLPEYRYRHDQDTQGGGFIFGKSSAGELLPHVNAWVTMFSLQAISLGADPDAQFDPFYLI